MNNMRREAITRLRAKLDAITSEIERLKTDEDIALGNLAEPSRVGQKGQTMYDAIAALDNATAMIGEADECLKRAAK